MKTRRIEVIKPITEEKPPTKFILVEMENFGCMSILTLT